MVVTIVLMIQGCCAVDCRRNYTPITTLLFGLLGELIRQFPERGRTGRSLSIEILVKPRAPDTACGLDAADLNALRAPTLFTMEDGEGRPADLAFRGG